MGATGQVEATLHQALALTRAEHMRSVLAAALRVQALLASSSAGASSSWLISLFMGMMHSMLETVQVLVVVAAPLANERRMSEQDLETGWSRWKTIRQRRARDAAGHHRSRIYGRLDCPAALRAIARGGYITHRVFFLDSHHARTASYRPCTVCLPMAYACWKAGPRGVSGTETVRTQ